MEIKGQVQEFPAKMYQFKNIYLQKKKLFVARRNLVHCSGHANNHLYCEKRNYCDMSYHADVVFTRQLNKYEKSYDDQMPTFFRFKSVTEKPYRVKIGKNQINDLILKE